MHKLWDPPPLAKKKQIQSGNMRSAIRNRKLGYKIPKKHLSPPLTFFPASYLLPRLLPCPPQLRYFIMGRRLPLNILQDILLRLHTRQSFRSIAKECVVDRKTVRRISTHIKASGRAYLPSTVVQGRPRELLPMQEKVKQVTTSET